MRRLSRLAVATGVSGALALSIGAGAAAARTTALDLTWTVKNLAGPTAFTVNYSGGVLGGMGGSATAVSGAIGAVVLHDGSLFLQPGSRLTATVDEWFVVGNAPVTGTASLPAGATASVVNQLTEKKFKIANGAFSIPTGVGTTGARPPAGGSRTVTCHGGARSCTARVSLAGGASNRRLVIRLSDTDFRLLSVIASPRRSVGAYVLTHGRLARGGSEYHVTLNAVKANPKGSHLLFRFGAVR